MKLAIVAHEKGWRLVLVSFSNLPSVANSNNAGNCLHDSSRPIEFTFDRKAPISTAAFPISLKDTKVIQNQMNNVVCYQNEDDLTTSVYDSVCWKIAQDGTSNVDNSLNELEESQLDHGRLSKSLISLAYSPSDKFGFNKKIPKCVSNNPASKYNAPNEGWHCSDCERSSESKTITYTRLWDVNIGKSRFLPAAEVIQFEQ